MSKFFDNEKAIPSGTLVIGIDVAKNLNFARAISHNGDFMKKSFKFQNTLSGFEELVREADGWIQQTESKDAIFALEPTGAYSVPIREYLLSSGRKVVYVNTYHVKTAREHYDNSPEKSDHKDALLIARLAIEGKTLKSPTLDEKSSEIRDKFSVYQGFVKNKVYWVNTLYSTLAMVFPEYESVFSNKSGFAAIAVLKKYPLPTDMIKAGKKRLGKLIAKASNNCLGEEKAVQLIDAARKTAGIKSKTSRESIIWQAEEIEHCIKQLKKVKNAIKKIITEMPIYDIISSIPDISVITAASLISYVGDMSSFRTADEVLKFLGLNVYEKASGQYRGRRKISKRGASVPRHYLTEAAVRLCKKEGAFRNKYEKMKSRGKNTRVIFTALSCKLVRLMFAMVKNDLKFDIEKINPIGNAEKNENTPLHAVA